ncbi:MAG TPA: phytanoyl-CoA dioxygenase family protein [Acidimicrobiales bacterium]|nr:phytanoyl-CoA dioxygenase family protein [Acidimicrobiales bacterium]
MDIGDWAATGSLNERYRELRSLGLESHVAELDAFGFTVVEPGRAAPVSFVERLRDRLLESATEATGVPHALDRPGDRGRYEGQPSFPSQYVLHFLALDDELYTQALLNPVAVSLASYLLGDDYRLSSLTGFVKWGESYGDGLGLHTDSPVGRWGDLPPNDGFVANVTWVLTDYTKENGALAIVPGSHRLARRPAPGEGVEGAVPIEAPTGSLIVWHGNTWHGAFPKTTPGLRLTLVSYLCRPYIRTQEDYRGCLTPEVRARLPRRMVEMLGGFDPYGWTKEGPQFATYKAMAAEAAAAENGKHPVPETVGGPTVRGALE